MNLQAPLSHWYLWNTLLEFQTWSSWVSPCSLCQSPAQLLFSALKTNVSLPYTLQIFTEYFLSLFLYHLNDHTIYDQSCSPTNFFDQYSLNNVETIMFLCLYIHACMSMCIFRYKCTFACGEQKVTSVAFILQQMLPTSWVFCAFCLFVCKIRGHLACNSPSRLASPVPASPRQKDTLIIILYGMIPKYIVFFSCFVLFYLNNLFFIYFIYRSQSPPLPIYPLPFLSSSCPFRKRLASQHQVEAAPRSPLVSRLGKIIQHGEQVPPNQLSTRDSALI